MEGASPINHYWCQKTRVIALSCGIKISAVHCLFLSQSTHVIDRQMHGQNYNSQDHAAVAASCSKNWVATESFRISCDLPTFCWKYTLNTLSGRSRSHANEGCQGTTCFVKICSFTIIRCSTGEKWYLKLAVCKFQVTKFSRHELTRKLPQTYEIWSMSSSFTENTGLYVVAKFEENLTCRFQDLLYRS